MKKLLQLVCTFLLLFPLLGVAAGDAISFRVTKTAPDLIAVDVSVDTHGQSYNALSGTISYDKNALVLVSAKPNTTLGVTWVEEPTRSDSSNSSTSFSLIVPGGFTNTLDPISQQTKPTLLYTLFFRYTQDKETSVVFDTVSAYINSKEGQEYRLGTFPLSIIPSAVATGNSSDADTIAPIIVGIQKIAPSFNAPLTPYILYVDAHDDQTGIASIEYFKKEWIMTKNPFPVHASFFRRTIPIRVTDGGGNVQEASVDIPGVSFIVIILFFVIIVGVWYVWKKNRRKNM